MGNLPDGCLGGPQQFSMKQMRPLGGVLQLCHFASCSKSAYCQLIASSLSAFYQFAVSPVTA